MSNIICGIDEPRPDFPDLKLDVPCCDSELYRGPGACTCWRPIYEGEQDTVRAAETVVRPDGMCRDCAYRPGSPEKAGDPEHRGDADDLEGLAQTGRPFYCHDGMRRIAKWVHPSGAEVPGHPADYAPPMVGPVPYRTDGTPAYLCAGWDARRRALAAKAAGS